MDLFRKASQVDGFLELRARVDAFCEEMSSLQVKDTTDLVPETLAKRMSNLLAYHEKLLDTQSKNTANKLLSSANKEEEKKKEEAKKKGDEAGGLDSEMCQEQEQEQENTQINVLEPDKDERDFAKLPPQKAWRMADLAGNSGELYSSKRGVFYPVAEMQPQFKAEFKSPKLNLGKWGGDIQMSSNYATKALPPEQRKQFRRLPNACVLLYNTRGTKGTWTVLTLSEAETARRWIDYESPENTQGIGLITSSGDWLTKPIQDLVMVTQPIKLYAAGPLVFTRFLNAEVHFDQISLISLVEVLVSMKPSARSDWLKATMQGRRRDRSFADLGHTMIEKAMIMKDSSGLRKNYNAIQSLGEGLKKQRWPTWDEAFNHYDKSGDQRLDVDEFRDCVNELCPSLTKDDVKEVYNYFDLNKSGYVDVKEFVRTLGFAEESSQDTVKALLDAQAGSKTAAATGGMRSASAHDTPGSIKRLEFKMPEKKVVRGLAAVLAKRSDEDSGFQVVSGHSVTFFGDQVFSCAVGGIASLVPMDTVLQGNFAFAYEVTIMEAPPGASCIVGVATPEFASDERVSRVGEDDYSWGVCGFGRKPTMHSGGNEVTSVEGDRWGYGTVIGVLVDLPRGEILTSVDGVEQPTVMENLPLRGQKLVVPAITVECGCKVHVNWGRQPLRYPPPRSRGSSDLTVERYGRLLADRTFRRPCEPIPRQGRSAASMAASAASAVSSLSPLARRSVQEPELAMEGVRPQGPLGEMVLVQEDRYSFEPKTKFTQPALGDPVYELELIGGHPFRSFCAIMAGALYVSGKWYYEVTLTQTTSLFFGVCVGWADQYCNGSNSDSYMGFSAGNESSWGLDVSRWEISADGDRVIWPYRQIREDEAKSGDVIGCMVDIDEGTMSFSWNGSMEPPVGLAFTKMKFRGGLRPVVTVRHGCPKLRINLRPAVCPEGYEPAADYVQRLRKMLLTEEDETLPARRFFAFDKGLADNSGPLRPSAGMEYVEIKETQLCALAPLPERKEGEEEMPNPRRDVGKDPLHNSSGWWCHALDYRPVLRANMEAKDGRFFYEVRIVHLFEPTLQDLYRAETGEAEDDSTKQQRDMTVSVGWSTPLFSGDHITTSVGDDRFSWGWQGADFTKPVMLKHNAESFGPQSQYPRWEETSVVGVACAIKDGKATINWTLNGRLINDDAACSEVDLTGYSVGGLVPAISMHPGLQMEVNFGPKFWYGAETADGFCPWEGSLSYQPLTSVEAPKAEVTKAGKRRSQSMLGFQAAPEEEKEQVEAVRPATKDVEGWRQAGEQAGDLSSVKEWLTATMKGVDGGAYLDLSSMVQADAGLRPFTQMLQLLAEDKDSKDKVGTRVKVLDLSRNPGIGGSVNGADGSLFFRQLTEVMSKDHIVVERLCLSHCGLKSEDATGQTSGIAALLAAGARSSSLRELDLAGNHLGPAVPALAPSLTEAEVLDLQDNMVTAEHLSSFLPELTHRQKVQNLHLGNNILGDVGAIALATELGYNRLLTELHLPNANISSKGVAALATCITPKHRLTRLNLSFNAIEAEGAAALSQLLTNYPYLKYLDVASGEIPSKGIREIAEALLEGKSLLQELRIGDNHLDDEAGKSIRLLLQQSNYMRCIDLGSVSYFQQFEAHQLLAGCRAPLQEIVFRGRSLQIEDQAMFLFTGCKRCMDLSTMDVGILSINNSKQRVAEFFDRPLTFLLNDGLKVKPVKKKQAAVAPVETAPNAGATDYLVKASARKEFIQFLINQRNSVLGGPTVATAPRKEAPGPAPGPAPAEVKQLPRFVDSRDARAAVHTVVGKIADESSSVAQKRWRMQVLLWMLGEDASLGFSKSRLVQLPVCNASLVSAPLDAPVLVHNASVRVPQDDWEVGVKEGGRTVLMEAIETGSEDIAILLIRRNSVKSCEFRQNGQDVSHVYCKMASADGEFSYDAQPDFVGLDDIGDAHGLTPIRKAAAKGAWPVVRALRRAGCRATDSRLCEGNKEGRTVWHDLATPEAALYLPGDDEEQLDLAKALLPVCDHLLARPDGQGRLPLHYCALYNHARLATLYLEAMDKSQELFNRTDDAGFSPLSLATFHGRLDVAKALLKKQEVALRVCKPPKQGATPLHWPNSPYRMALLQHFFWGAPRRGNALLGSNHGADLKLENEEATSVFPKTDRMDVTKQLLVLFHDTEAGATHRFNFLVRYIAIKFLGFLVLFALLYFLSQVLFLGGPVAQVHPLPWKLGVTTWHMQRRFNDNLLHDELPWVNNKFEKTFDDMNNIDDYWDFMEGNLADVLFPENNQFGAIGGYTYLLGSVRIQRRSYDMRPCDNPFEGFATVMGQCIYDIGPWKDAFYLQRGDRDTAVNVLASLKTQEWLAGQASVRVDFSVFNTQLRSIMLTKLVVDFKPSGLVQPFQDSRIFRRLPLDELHKDLYTFILLILLGTFTLVYLVIEGGELVASGWQYAADRSQLFDLAQGVLLLVVCGLLLLLMWEQTELNQSIASTEYVDYNHIHLISEWLQGLFGMMFIFQTLRCIKIWRLMPGVGPSIQAIGQTLADATVLRFLMFLLAVVLGFGLGMQVIFGSKSPGFSNITQSVFAVYRFTFGDWEYDDMTSLHYWWGYALFILLTFLITGTMGNVFIAVVGERYNSHLSDSFTDWRDEVNLRMAMDFGDRFAGWKQRAKKGDPGIRAIEADMRKAFIGTRRPVSEAAQDAEGGDKKEQSVAELSAALRAARADLEQLRVNQASHTREMQRQLDRQADLLQELLDHQRPNVNSVAF